MSIRGVLDGVFRFTGGFAISQLFLPTFVINSKGGLWVNNSTNNNNKVLGSSSMFPKGNALNDLNNNCADTTLKIIDFITPPAVSKLIEKGLSSWQITHRTLTEDIEYWKYWNQWLTMSLVFVLVWTGGVYAIGGAATSIYLTGPKGSERYVNMKKWYRKNIAPKESNY